MCVVLRHWSCRLVLHLLVRTVAVRGCVMAVQSFPWASSVRHLLDSVCLLSRLLLLSVLSSSSFFLLLLPSSFPNSLTRNWLVWQRGKFGNQTGRNSSRKGKFSLLGETFFFSVRCLCFGFHPLRKETHHGIRASIAGSRRACKEQERGTRAPGERQRQ